MLKTLKQKCSTLKKPHTTKSKVLKELADGLISNVKCKKKSDMLK